MSDVEESANSWNCSEAIAVSLAPHALLVPGGFINPDMLRHWRIELVSPVVKGFPIFLIRDHPRKSAVSFCLSDPGAHGDSLFLCG